MALLRGKLDWPAGVWQLLLRVAVVLLVVYALWRVRFIVATTLAAVMLAYAILPLTRALEQLPLLKGRREQARRILCTALVFILLGALVGWMLAAIARPLVAEVREFFENSDLLARDFERRFYELKIQYERLPPEVQSWLRGVWQAIAGSLVHQLQAIVGKTLHAGMLVVELILLPVLAFYFVTESGKFKKEFAFLVPRRHWRDAVYLLRQSSLILQSYAVGQIILAVLAGVVVWALLHALSIRYALAMGVVAGVTRAIPIIGPIIGGVPIVLLATIQSWEKGLMVLGAFTLLHLVESKVIMPHLIGYRMNLHPAIIIIVLLIGAEFWGMWGMFVAAPVAAILKVAINRFWIAPGRRASLRRRSSSLGTREELEVGRPAIAGTGSHPGTHGVHPG